MLDIKKTAQNINLQLTELLKASIHVVDTQVTKWNVNNTPNKFQSKLFLSPSPKVTTILTFNTIVEFYKFFLTSVNGIMQYIFFWTLNS